MNFYFRVLLLSLICAALPSMAVDVVEFDSPRDHERYQQLTYELRCPKCQNQNLIDSNSQISEDLRDEVVRLIKEGKTDSEIKEYMVSLYGDFILYKPPLQKNTIVLWAGPVLMLILGMCIFGVIIFKRSRMNEDDEIGSIEDDSTNSDFLSESTPSDDEKADT
ncbi:cytochrome c-type biogenesis protein [Agarilytica rhodophyticola]|uniref:cytochrome c-type biogenesis protein n=1 Tax=Agarilytica rhodophyticola TaxID=1737490 RepID=UPI001FE44A65|nr:cytochrome c-type biogenesis protein [Agarilytica rhodophyticola]